jgi:hypothetical protein
MAINCVGGLPGGIEGYQIQGAQGIQGIQGAQGTQGVQGLKGPTGLPAPATVFYPVTFAGSWSGGTYTPNTVVVYNSNQYISINQVQGGSPPPFAPADWREVGLAPTRTASGNVAFDPETGGGYSWNDIEIDYSAYIGLITAEFSKFNDTHWQIKELMETLVEQVTLIRADQDIMAQQQIKMAIHQANMDASMASIRDNHDLIRIVQEHMRKLADTTGITTRSPYDYLYTYSTVRGLELDNISIGQAINTFNGLPAQTLASPSPAQMPPPASKMMWKGSWDESKTYVKDDIVFYGGKAFAAVKTSVGAPPENNKLWKSVEDTDVVKSEEPKEVWKGTWNKNTNYPAGSIVMFKEGLEGNHINSLNDLVTSSAEAKIYKAMENIPSYLESNKKPNDPPDAAGHTCWELVTKDEEFDECATTPANGIQIVSITGDFTCEDNSLGNLVVDSPVIVKKICYTIDDFVQMYKGTYSASVYKTRAQEIIPLYTGNDEYIVGSDTRYGIARYPDHGGLAYWTTTSLQQGWSATSTELVTAFFNSLDTIVDYTRHLNDTKAFDNTSNGCGFLADPDGWSAGSTQSFIWTSRTVPNTLGIGHPAWGTKMNTYAIWDAPGVYNPIFRPISGTDGVCNIGVNRPIKISILGGPPNSTVQITKSANVNDFFGVGYIAGTVLSGTLTLDAEGNFVDTSNFFSIVGVATYTTTFDSVFTLLNGYTRTYTVNVLESYIEPQIPSNPKTITYDLARQLNIGYEFTREVVINFPFDGTYIFQGFVDNWGKITLDGNTVLDFNNNFLDTSDPVIRALPIKKGNHIVKLFAINYGPQTSGNPGGIGLSIVSGGIGLIHDHKGTKTYKIKTTNGINAFKLVNLDNTEISTTPGLAEGYIFNIEKKSPNYNTTEIEFKGCWEDCTIYKVHQMVLHSETTWISTKDNTGNEPKEGSRYWRKITTEEAAFIDDPPTWKGSWSDENTYVKHSIVSYLDKSWISLKLVQSTPTPPSPDNAPDDWKEVNDDTIRCQVPEGAIVEPEPPPAEEDTTLTYQGTFDPEADYAAFDVVDTVLDDLIFLDPPRINDLIPIQDIVVDGAEPPSNFFDEAQPYAIGDIILFPSDAVDPDYYVCVRPVLPSITNSPDNNPSAWAKLLPVLKPTGETYDPNDIIPLYDPLTGDLFPDPDTGKVPLFMALRPIQTVPTSVNTTPGQTVPTSINTIPGWVKLVPPLDSNENIVAGPVKFNVNDPYKHQPPAPPPPPDEPISPVNIIGTVPTENDLPLTADPNDAYINAENGSLYIFDGTDWINDGPNNIRLNSTIWKDISEYTAGPPVNFIGPWDWRTYYNKDDVVIFCDILYKAVEPSIGAVPPYNINNIPDTAYPETKWIKLEIILGT